VLGRVQLMVVVVGYENRKASDVERLHIDLISLAYLGTINDFE